jgi:drug/metabolite transporter (DMT)-like permease
LKARPATVKTAQSRLYGKLVLMAVLWAGAFPATRILLEGMGAYTATFVRFWWAGLLLALLVVARDGALPRLAARDWAYVVALAVIGVFGYNLAFSLGLAQVEASRASLIVPINPAVTAAAAWLLLREPMGAPRALGIALCVAGALWILSRGDPAAFLALDFSAGELFLVACIFLWSAYTLLGRLALARVPPLVLTAYATLVGGALLALPAAFEDQSLRTVPWQSWAALAYLVPFATVVPFVWFWQGVRAIGAARASQFINLCPPVAVAESVLLLGEPFTPALVVGTVLVVAGLYLTNRANRIAEPGAS